MMFNTARRITVNFLSLVTSQVIARLIQLVIFVYLARSLGKEDFGIFSFGFAFALLFAMIVDFGLNLLLVREISRNKSLASRYLSNAMMIKIFLAIITLIFANLFLNIMNYSQETKIVAYIMLAFALIQSFTELYLSIFRAFERMYYDALIKALRTILLLAAIFYLIINGYGLIASSLAFLLTEIIILLISALVTYYKFVKAHFELDYKFSRDLIKESFSFFLSVIFTTFYMYINQIMISKFYSTTEVGVYSVAANIVIMLIFIPQMYGNSIYPVLSRFYVSSKKSLKFAYEKSLKYMIIIGLPIALGIYILAEKIILFLYGEEYLESAIVLSILCGYLFLKFLNPMTGYALMAINRQGSRLFSQGLSALLNIILNLILIPVYGLVGAAIATLITEIAFFIIYTSFIIRYGFKFKFIFAFIYKPIIAAAIMGFLLPFIRNLFLAIILGMFIYIAALLALRIVDKEDKSLFNKIVRNA